MEEQPKLHSCSFEFYQEGNCISDRDECEFINIDFCSDVGIDDSEGGFFVIKTEKWSVNDENDLKLLFDRIKQLMNKP